MELWLWGRCGTFAARTRCSWWPAPQNRAFNQRWRSLPSILTRRLKVPRCEPVTDLTPRSSACRPPARDRRRRARPRARLARICARLLRPALVDRVEAPLGAALRGANRLAVRRRRRPGWCATTAAPARRSSCCARRRRRRSASGSCRRPRGSAPPPRPLTMISTGTSRRVADARALEVPVRLLVVAQLAHASFGCASRLAAARHRHLDPSRRAQFTSLRPCQPACR